MSTKKPILNQQGKASSPERKTQGTKKGERRDSLAVTEANSRQ
jgi:hypothetical protein